MTLHEFQQLSLDEQIELTNGAACIGKRENILNSAFLYRLENFYVEVLWKKPQHYIVQVNGFDEPQRLALYEDLENEQ